MRHKAGLVSLASGAGLIEHYLAQSPSRSYPAQARKSEIRRSMSLDTPEILLGTDSVNLRVSYVSTFVTPVPYLYAQEEQFTSALIERDLTLFIRHSQARYAIFRRECC